MTPLNLSTTKLNGPVPTSIPHTSQRQLKNDQFEKDIERSREPLGIYANLVYISTLVTGVFVRMFERIEDSRLITRGVTGTGYDSELMTLEDALCFRFVGKYHFMAFNNKSENLVITNC
ncbi:hypothetical protein BY996DRAFT_6414275 [Phakopsora pachyrhizi]|nr:hypothetical protein BY996DRAFT_6414275 [Phakopsora pachyrhizi]